MEGSEPPSAEDAWARRGLLAVLAIGLFVRLLYLVELPTYPAFHQPEVDAWHYHQLAQRIVAGDAWLDGMPARMSPGYTYFLAAVYAVVGSGPWMVRIVQLVLGLGTVWLLWGAARELVGARWALLPAAVAALYGPFIYHEGHLLAAALGVFLHALLLYEALRLRARSAVPALRWLGLGVIWGACVVVRPNALLLLGPLAVLVYERARRPGCWAWTRHLGLVALGGALAIAPLTLRNVVATGEPALVTSHGGVNFYVGNGPGATGTWRIPPDLPGAHSPLAQFETFHRVAEQVRGRTLTPAQVDAYWYARTLAVVEAEPVAWLRLMLRKLHLFWNGRELHNVYDYEFWRHIGLVLAAPLPQFLWIAPFGLVGSLWLLLRAPAERFVALFSLASCAALVLVFVTDRYRLPAVTAILLAGTVVVRELVAALRARERRVLAWLLPALLVGVAVAVPVQVNKRFEQKYYQIGSAWMGLQRFERAHWAYERSLEVDPDFLPTHRRLAELYEQVGEPAKALVHWRRVAELAERAGDAESAQAARARVAQLRASAGAGP